MRILLLTPDFPPAPGGIQNLAARLAAGLAAAHQVLVVAPRQPGAAAWDRGRPFRVRRIPSGGSGAVILVSGTALGFGAIARWHPDVVVCVHVLLAPPCRLARMLLGIPYVVIGHGSEFGSRRIRPVARLGVRGAARMTTGSRFTIRAMAALGADPARIALLKPGPGLEPDGEPPAAAPSAEGRVLLTVSRLVEPYKGHDMVIRALPLVLAKVPDARYVIVGDGPLRRRLQRLAASVGVAEAVTFTGRLDTVQLIAWYRRCDTFIMASRDSLVGGGAEGFGMVFLEAALFGKPVIAGRSGGIEDAVEHDVTGLLVDPGDVGAISDAIVRVLGDRELAARLGAAGRRRATEELAWPRYVRAFEDVLHAARSGPP